MTDTPDEVDQLRQLLVDEVSAVLLLSTVSDDANFIDLGATSLSLLTLHARIKRKIGTDFPFRFLFTYPTVRSLADQLHER